MVLNSFLNACLTKALPIVNVEVTVTINMNAANAIVDFVFARALLTVWVLMSQQGKLIATCLEGQAVICIENHVFYRGMFNRQCCGFSADNYTRSSSH